jgi:hypothetical protein
VKFWAGKIRCVDSIWKGCIGDPTGAHLGRCSIWDTDSMEHKGCLELVETTDHPFPDLIWCRVDIGRYRLKDPGCSDREILDSVLADDRAAHSYIAPRPSPYLDSTDQVPVHGPYVLSELDVDSFDLSTPAELWARLQEFVSEWEPVNRTLADLRLDDLLVPNVENSDSVYRLREDPNSFHPVHAQLEIIGCFSEFVVIAKASRTVLDIITAQD